MSSCCPGSRLKGADIALAGNPNVGKSMLINQLTSIGAVVSNYPGTTVEILEGEGKFKGKTFRVADLPGTYSLKGVSEDETVAIKYLNSAKPKVIINVVDATKLERNLFLTLQLLKLETPTIIALNFHDEAEKKGMFINNSKLSALLGVPVIPINALTGIGISALLEQSFASLKNKRVSRTFRRSRHRFAGHLDVRKFHEFTDRCDRAAGHLDVRKFQDLRTASGRRPLDSEEQLHSTASKIAAEATTVSLKKSAQSLDWLDKLTTTQLSGTIILLTILAILFASLFIIGGNLSDLLGNLFEAYAVPSLLFVISLVPNTTIQEILKSMFIDGIDAGLQIAIPFIFVFYAVIAILEDSGYIPRMAFLLDKVMYKFGLHGKAIIPMMLGFGCTVPAIISTRVMQSGRERLLTTILILLIPCSARTAVILGAVGMFLGWQYALLLYGFILVLILITGAILGKALPGERQDLVMEIPPYRMPSAKNVFMKTWIRVNDFIFAAFPLIFIGSGILGGLRALGLLAPLLQPAEPIIVGWLMLPVVAGITLLFGILRKELALELLIVLGGSANLLSFMTPIQIFTFALVVSIYVPCIATIGILKREFGWKKCLLISFSTIVLAVLIGGIAARLMPMLGFLK